jgi:hypothetical protein
MQARPPRRTLYGVDITETRFVDRPKCMHAAAFAAKAHEGRFRKSGEPYVHHSVSTAIITEQMMLHLFSDDEWAVRRYVCVWLHALWQRSGTSALRLALSRRCSVAAVAVEPHQHQRRRPQQRQWLLCSVCTGGCVAGRRSSRATAGPAGSCKRCRRLAHAGTE